MKVNFLIFYEIDQQTVKTVLRLDDYDSEWVLLASDAAVPIEPGPREAHTLADPNPLAKLFRNFLKTEIENQKRGSCDFER